MSWGSIRIGVCEPLMFRAAGELDPWIRGPAVRALSLPLPLPSTIAGALATARIEEGLATPPSPNEVGEWYDEIASRTGVTVLRGPYLLVDDDVYVWYHTGLVKLRNLLRVISSLDIDIIRGKKEDEKPDKYLKERLKASGKDALIPTGVLVHERTRIKLALRSNGENRGAEQGKEKAERRKAPERGYLFITSFIDYYRVKPSARISIIAEVLGDPEVGKAVIRLGGEGRIAVLSTRPEAPARKEIEKALQKSAEEHIVYIASPLLLETLSSPDYLAKPRAAIEELLRKEIAKTGAAKEPSVEALQVKIGILGAGYSLARKRRKPIYAAIMPGSLFLVEGLSNPLKLYDFGIGVASQLGYGTVLPIPRH